MHRLFFSDDIIACYCFQRKNNRIHTNIIYDRTISKQETDM